MEQKFRSGSTMVIMSHMLMMTSAGIMGWRPLESLGGRGMEATNMPKIVVLLADGLSGCKMLIDGDEVAWARDTTPDRLLTFEVPPMLCRLWNTARELHMNRQN